MQANLMRTAFVALMWSLSPSVHSSSGVAPSPEDSSLVEEDAPDGSREDAFEPCSHRARFVRHDMPVPVRVTESPRTLPRPASDNTVPIDAARPQERFSGACGGLLSGVVVPETVMST
ncbi:MULTISPECIES: hypothetical protein [Dyella]|uniref:Secreted protein n=2 Tax=Dyella TaxID=231454 RepID=A0A4R0Z0K0_9GAMM|nr:MULTISPECIES: hypothetical protein [Dyella]TBR39527.1 hypothetical protein EYV96_04770 [Dyella terrae]TCI12888.1 hypothetical protein EZM97_06100 [Dyella soli]